jgi:hypothetical protein
MRVSFQSWPSGYGLARTRWCLLSGIPRAVKKLFNVDSAFVT